MKKKNKSKVSKPAVRTAPAPAAAVESQTVESRIVPRTCIVPSPTNPRKTFTNLDELAQSIRAQGIVQPIVVRRVPQVELIEPDMLPGSKWQVKITQSDGTVEYSAHDLEQTARMEYEMRKPGKAQFEIIAGERRWRGAELAELDQVPVVVRAMSDKQVIEAQHVENLQREGVSPAEEAESYRKLLDTKIHTVDSLAERLGIKRSTLYLRLKLTRISPAVRVLVDAKRMPWTVAELVGRLPGEKLQKLALEKLMRGEYEEHKDGDYLPNCVSFRRAKEILEDDFVVDLKGAPFDTETRYEGKIRNRLKEDGEADLALVGPCSTCPRRSGNCKEEFPDIESPNVCTDPDCFAAKRSAQEKELRHKYEAEGAHVVTGKDAQKCFGYYSDEPANGYTRLDAQYPGTNKPIKKLLKGVEPTPTFAIVKGKAKKIYALEDVHKALVEAGVEVKAPKKETQTTTDGHAARQAALKEKAKAMQPIAEEAYRQVLAKAKKELTPADVFRLLLTQDVYPSTHAVAERRGVKRSQLEKQVPKMAADELLMLTYESLFDGDLVSEWDAKFLDTLEIECKRYGIDLEKLGNELKLDDAPSATKKKGGKK